MSKRKAFWISFALTLGLLIPLYAVALFLGTAGISDPDTPAAGEGVGIAVRRPDAGDAKNLLVVVQGDQAAFLLLRFDALQGKCAVAALPADLPLTREDGEQTTLAGLEDYAGPGVAAKRIAALLEIEIDHYLSLPQQTLIELAERMGNITVDVSWPELAGRQALLEGQGERVTLSADGAAALLERAGEKAGGLRARIYSAFLLAGMDRLNTLIPDFLRSASGDLDTDILATDIYDYQRILDYLALLQPEMLFGELTFTETGEPAGESLQLAAQMFR